MPRIGTPGFTGGRLREAREARGISAITLAELVGISPQAVSQYEHGSTAPTPDRLYVIASKLSMPVDFFVQPERVPQDRVIFYRARMALTKQSMTKADRRLDWLLDVIDYLSAFVQFFRFEPLDVPDWSTDNQTDLPSAFIDDTAMVLRREWNLGDGPIPSMVALLESKGAIVTRGVVETLTIDAFSVLAGPEKRPCIFLGSDKDSAARSRFDAAHELGHAVLHRQIGPRHEMKRDERKRVEREANVFASAFLLPASGFARDLAAPTLEAMQIAKRKWVVSIGAMVHRMADLEMIPEQEAQRLWIARTRRGWHRHEPLDDVLPVETPRALSAAFESIVDQGVRSKAEIVNDLRLNPNDIEALAGLPEGFFGDSEPPVQLLDRARLVSFPGGS